MSTSNNIPFEHNNFTYYYSEKDPLINDYITKDLFAIHNMREQLVKEEQCRKSVKSLLNWLSLEERLELAVYITSPQNKLLKRFDEVAD